MNINKENDGGSSVVNKLKSRFDPISCHQSKQLRGVSVPVVFLFVDFSLLHDVGCKIITGATSQRSTWRQSCRQHKQTPYLE